MFITIDANRCAGHGRCYAVAPDLVSDDDEGFVAQRGQCWEVPTELEKQALEAAESCPEAAITVTAGRPDDA